MIYTIEFSFEMLVISLNSLRLQLKIKFRKML